MWTCKESNVCARSFHLELCNDATEFCNSQQTQTEVLVRQEPLSVSERSCNSTLDQAFHLTMGSSQSSEKRGQKRQVKEINQIGKKTKQSRRRPGGQTQRRGGGHRFAEGGDGGWGGGVGGYSGGGDCGGGGGGGGD